MNDEVNKWYYIPENKWFKNRKEVKQYLGGTLEFNNALRRRDVIYIINTDNNN